MNIRKALTAVAMTAVFLCSNIAVNADYSDEYAADDLYIIYMAKL